MFKINRSNPVSVAAGSFIEIVTELLPFQRGWGLANLWASATFLTMCNRYSLSKKQERMIKRQFGAIEFDFKPRYNIAPTQKAPVVVVEDGRLACKEMQWGFKPAWSKAPVTNAQFETLPQKPTFKDAFASRRCLVPADGFYEWTTFCAKRQPIRHALAGEPLFFFAGLWSVKV